MKSATERSNTAIITPNTAAHFLWARMAGITSKADLSTKNLERLGFTQYKKAGGGKYEKTAGQGPDMISKE